MCVYTHCCFVFSLYYNRFEKYYDPIPVLDWMSDHPSVPMMACTLYVVLIVLGQRIMKDREAFKWRKALAAWNLFLAVFSGMGTLRTLPQLLHNLSTMSLRDNMCSDPRATYGSGSSGLWVQLFILSKIP